MRDESKIRDLIATRLSARVLLAGLSRVRLFEPFLRRKWQRVETIATVSQCHLFETTAGCPGLSDHNGFWHSYNWLDKLFPSQSTWRVHHKQRRIHLGVSKLEIVVMSSCVVEPSTVRVCCDRGNSRVGRLTEKRLRICYSTTNNKRHL